MRQRLVIRAHTLVSALGAGRAATLDALRSARTGLARSELVPLELMVGAVDGLEGIALPELLRAYDCRNSRLAEAALDCDGFADHVERARARYGADQVGVFVGSSTAGIRETEDAFLGLGEDDALPPDFPYATTHRVGSVAAFVRERLELAGPAVTVATACSSSAKVFAQAARYIAGGLCRAAVVGGVDSLCRTTIHGFHALELTAADYCRPFAAERDGLCLGEAGAFALLEPDLVGVSLLGYGESTDAHHMSTPDPEATGAVRALRSALRSAHLDSNDIDYVNAHGTATPTNDAAEGKAITGVLGRTVPVSSTKGWTGHTLGAAGAVEAVLTTIALEEQMVPGTLNTRGIDPAIECNAVIHSRPATLRHALSNSFGFGGSNCTLVLGYPR